MHKGMVRKHRTLSTLSDLFRNFFQTDLGEEESIEKIDIQADVSYNKAY